MSHSFPNEKFFDNSIKPLPREFYLHDAVTVAKSLLGKRLVHRVKKKKTMEITSGIIVETEAYAGREDAACHSYKRESPVENHRTNIMFADGGVAYVYLIYGMYNCFNVVANVAGNPEAVLIRALEPREGIELMQKRRQQSDRVCPVKNLCSGPGKLCLAMEITRDDYGKDLCGNEIFITDGETITEKEIAATPRINVDYAGDDALLLYRFVIKENRFLSTRKFLEK